MGKIIGSLMHVSCVVGCFFIAGVAGDPFLRAVFAGTVSSGEPLMIDSSGIKNSLDREIQIPSVSLEVIESTTEGDIQIIERGLPLSLLENITTHLGHMGVSAKLIHKPSSGQPVKGSLETFHGLLGKKEFLENLFQVLQTVSLGHVTLMSESFQIEGSVESDKEKAIVINTLTSLLPEGYNLESMLKVEAPLLSPYPLTLIKSTDKRVHVSGGVPSDSAKDRLLQRIQTLYGGSSNISSTIKIAAGMPTDRWIAFVQQAMPLLTLVNEGTLEIRDKILILKGVTENPVQILNRMSLLKALYPTYQVTFMPEAQQVVAKPYRMNIQKSPTNVIQIEGVLPNPDAYTSLKKLIQGVLPQAEMIEQVTYADGMPDGNWLKLLNQSVTAILPLSSGSVQLEDRTLTVAAGAKTRSQRDKAATILTQTAFPAYQQTISLVDRPSLLNYEYQKYAVKEYHNIGLTNRQSVCLKELEDGLKAVPFQWIASEKSFLEKNKAAFWTLGETMSHCRGIRLIVQVDAARPQRKVFQKLIFQGLSRMGTDMSHLIFHSGIGESARLSFVPF